MSQELPGQADLTTTMIYKHVPKSGPMGLISYPYNFQGHPAVVQ